MSVQPRVSSPRELSVADSGARVTIRLALGKGVEEETEEKDEGTEDDEGVGLRVFG